ncbi:threonylcarbamoyl-AMP synthase [Candidatus Woesebacteria bacterium]|nr:MAG: threonylcarbamoyl-AMP synthase [Candidatus Woesebacteria bacterium]
MILKIDFTSLSNDAINKAVSVLTNGGVVVYPTDTCYGIGVNAFNIHAVNKLYDIKGRDVTKPTHVVVRDWKMIEDLAYPNSLAKTLFDKFLPGPLTMILNKKPNVLDILTGGLSTLGVRIPNSHLTSKLSKLVDFPYTTPSANRTGEPSPYSFEEVMKVLDLNKVDLILDAGFLPHNPPSTIVDVTKMPYEMLREGPITNKQVKYILGL